MEEAHPDFAGLHDVFLTLRTYDFFMRKAKLLRQHRDLLKPEVIWNVEKGLKITLEEMERAENQRVALAQRYLAFFDRYDLLLTPATVVAPYPIENRFVAEVNGHKFANYVEWLATRSGPERNKPRRLGSAAYEPLCDAPGTYVHDR